MLSITGSQVERTSRRAPRRSVNPFLWRRIERCGLRKSALATASGFAHYALFHSTLHAEKIAATPSMIARLTRVADLVGFPKGEIFLDEASR